VVISEVRTMVTTPRISTAALVAALLVLPEISAAQTQPQTDTTARGATATGEADSAEARAHLSNARQTLADLTKLPEAAQLTGETRTLVESVIKHFNQMITSKADWTTDFAQVRDSLDRLLGPAPQPAVVDRPVGTSGSAGTTLDPAIASKLEEFRSHLTAFHAAAGSPPLSGEGAPVSPASPPSPSPPPPEPASPPPAPEPASPPPVPTPEAEPPSAPPPDLSRPARSSVTVGNPTPISEPATAQQAVQPSEPSPVATSGPGSAAAHLDDLASMVNDALATGSGGSVVIERTTLDAMKLHIDQLRSLLGERR
jgi:hypothetical protein